MQLDESFSKFLNFWHIPEEDNSEKYWRDLLNEYVSKEATVEGIRFQL
jgi:hypothetical protein